MTFKNTFLSILIMLCTALTIQSAEKGAGRGAGDYGKAAGKQKQHKLTNPYARTYSALDHEDNEDLEVTQNDPADDSDYVDDEDALSEDNLPSKTKAKPKQKPAPAAAPASTSPTQNAKKPKDPKVLARKAELARQARRRKKARGEELDKRLQQLEIENAALKKKLLASQAASINCNHAATLASMDATILALNAQVAQLKNTFATPQPVMYYPGFVAAQGPLTYASAGAGVLPAMTALETTLQNHGVQSFTHHAGAGAGAGATPTVSPLMQGPTYMPLPTYPKKA